MKINTLIILCVCLALALGGYFFYTQLMNERAEEEREDLVWLARCELETLRNDPTVGYLRLKNIKYENEKLELQFRTYLHADTVADKLDKGILDRDFMSLVVLHPEKWTKVAEYLTEANVNVSITYLSLKNYSFVLTGKQLSEMISDKQLFDEGMALFSYRKQKEVLEYARQHFRKDFYFKADTVLLGDKYLSLHLLYDNTRAQLGPSYLDSSRVSLHFTDKVGDMGSILDGMLSICSRYHKGFSFVYKGKKDHRVKRCFYSATKAKEMYDERVGKLWLDKREVNRVRTVIYRTRK